MAHPEIEEWLNSAVGVAMNPDGSYGLQCVDVADQYAQDITGVPWPQSIGGVAGANGLLDAAPDKYWTRIDNNGSPDQIPQRGDVIVWAGDSINQWGHVAIVESADVHGVNVIQQDGFAPPLIWANGGMYSNKPAHRARLAYSQPGTGHTLGWLRPKLASVAPPTPAPAPAPAPPALAEYQRKAGADQIAYRKSPSTNGEFISWLDAGKVYDFKGFVRGETVSLPWVTSNIWLVGKYTGGYAWAGLFNTVSTAGLPDLTVEPKPPALAAPNERTVGKIDAYLRKGSGTNFGLMTGLPGAEDGKLKPDHTYQMKGYVRGQKVGDTDVWFVSKSGGYAHSAAFTNTGVAGLSDLTPKAAEVPAPSTPEKPPAPVMGYSFNKSVSCVTEVLPARVGHFQAEGLPKRPMKIVVHQFDGRDKGVHIDSVVNWFRSENNDRLSASHFVVEGSRIVQMVGLGVPGKTNGDRAYHAGPAGNDFIGIETYVGPNGMDAATFASVVRLIVELQALYGYVFELVDHRSLASTSCGADVDIPAYKAAVSKAPATSPSTPPATDDLAAFAAHMHAQIDAYVASKRK